ncbi:MAG: hypothetical protein AAGA85_00400 [Bacteroidota bacterium]
MSPNQFSAMPVSHQLRWVYFEGEFITSIRYYQFKVNLYRVEDFLVEVFYDPKADRIAKVELMMRYSTRMKFYADQVKLPADIDRLTSH